MNLKAATPSVNDTTRSRYPGTRPFSDSADDYARFFGRVEEGEQLYLRVLSVPLAVQFGKSGLGKTSLLQAFLFPRLRQKPFLPVMVRLNDTSDTLVRAVVRAIQLACLAEGLEFTEGGTEGLWELLSATTVWRDDLLLTPVLVFDQFEEVFTLRDASFRAGLAVELGALASGIAPERLHANTAAVPEHYAVRPNVKILISLREDYLGALQEFSAAIPDLFHERLRLEPLSEEAAREAITAPAQLTAGGGEEPYWAPCFDFEQAAIDAMVDYLKGNSGVIEPFQLQLLSRHAEAIAHAKGGPQGDSVELTLKDFTGGKAFSFVLNNFYRNTLHKLPRVQRKKAGALCEEGLLDASGNRLPLEEKQILSKFRLKTDTLATLLQERIIRRERRLESVFYEISHDRLAESIAASRPFKLPRNVKRKLRAAIIMFLLIVGGLIWRNQDLQTARNLAERALYQAERSRNQAERARNQAERLISFLLGENFLGEIRDGGRSELLEQVQKQVDTYRGNGDKEPTLNRGLALRNSGDLKRTKGLISESVTLFEEAQAIFKMRPDNFDSRREIARTHQRLGEAYVDLGNFAQSLSHYETSVNAWRQVVSDATNSDVKMEVCTNLADDLVLTSELKNRMGDAAGALTHLESAAEITLNLIFGGKTGHDECNIEKAKVEPYPNAKALNVLSSVALMQAIVSDSYESEDFKNAFSMAVKANWLRPTSISAKNQTIVFRAQQGNSSLAEKPQNALNDYRKVLEGFDELQRWDTSNRLWQRERAATQLLVSEGIVGCHDSNTKGCNPKPSLEEAEALSLESVATLRELAQIDDHNMSLQIDIAWALHDHAQVLEKQGRYDECLATLKEAERIIRKNPLSKEDSGGVYRLASILIEKAKVWAMNNRLPEAKADLQSAIDLFEQLLKVRPDNLQFTSWLSIAYLTKRDILQEAGDKAAAEASKNAAKRLENRYSALKGEREKRANKIGDVILMHWSEGDKLYSEGEYAAALSKFNLAEAAMREYLCDKPTSFIGYEVLGNIYKRIELLDQELGKIEKRGAPLEAAMHASQIAVWLAPEKIDQARLVRKMLVNRFDLAIFLLQNKDSDGALAVMQAGVVVAEGFLPENTKNAPYIGMLGFAKCGQGMIRRHLKKTGWEEVIRSGLIHLQNAGNLEPKNLRYKTDEGVSRKFLAEALDADGREDKAREEYKLALKAYKKAAKLNPGDENVVKAIRELENQENR